MGGPRLVASHAAGDGHHLGLIQRGVADLHVAQEQQGLDVRLAITPVAEPAGDGGELAVARALGDHLVCSHLCGVHHQGGTRLHRALATTSLVLLHLLQQQSLELGHQGQQHQVVQVAARRVDGARAVHAAGGDHVALPVAARVDLGGDLAHRLLDGAQQVDVDAALRGVDLERLGTQGVDGREARVVQQLVPVGHALGAIQVDHAQVAAIEELAGGDTPVRRVARAVHGLVAQTLDQASVHGALVVATRVHRVLAGGALLPLLRHGAARAHEPAVLEAGGPHGEHGDAQGGELLGEEVGHVELALQGPVVGDDGGEDSRKNLDFGVRSSHDGFL